MAFDDDDRARWLARWILPHEPALRRWLRRSVVPGIEIDDIVQETYGLLAGLGSVEHIRDPRAYLFTTARSVVLQQVRRNRVVSIERMTEIDALCIEQVESSTERAVSMHQQLALLADQIARLPGKCREAFVLRKIHGLSQREIAERMGIAESTVEKHIGKGLRLVMAAMGGRPPLVGESDGQVPAAGHAPAVSGRRRR